MDLLHNRVFKHTEQFLGSLLLGLILLGCLVVLRPFASAILWAAILCYATWPACEWLVRHFKGHRPPAALIMTIGLVLLIALPITLLGTSLVSSVEHLVVELRRINAEGLPTAPEWLSTLPWLGDFITAHWSDLALNADRTTELLGKFLLFSRKWLLRNSLLLGQGTMQVFLSILVCYFIYRDGYEVARRVTELSNRVVGEYTQHLITLVGDTVRGVVYGVIGTALGQGIMAAIGFAIVGLPAALFWALMVSLLALLPFGPPIVWISATVWLIMQESFGWAVFMAIWGAAGISGIDNVLRPYLISRNSKLSFLPVLLGVLGGIAVFGLIGIFLGPTLLAVGMNMIKEFSSRTHDDAAESSPSNSDLLTPPPNTDPQPRTADVREDIKQNSNSAQQSDRASRNLKQPGKSTSVSVHPSFDKGK